jgi:hypothetical protein
MTSETRPSAPLTPIAAAPASGPIARFGPGVLLSILTGVAAAVRAHHLGLGSLWIDEAASVMFVRMSWGRFLAVLWEYEANMTFYYLLLRVWIHLGDSEVVLRSLSVILGVALMPAAYALGRRLVGQRAALLGTALLCVHVLHVFSAQEARCYSLLVLLLVLSTLFFVRAVESPGRHGPWIGYAVTSVLAVYSHFFAALVLAAQWLAVGPSCLREIGRRRLAAIGLGLVVPLTPLAVFVLLHDRGQLDWIPSTTLGSVLLLLVMLSSYNPLLFVAGLVGLVWSLRARGKTREEAWRTRLLGLWFAFPIVVVLLVSVFKPLLFFRYFEICVPPFVLLASRALTPPPASSRLKTAAFGLVIAATLALSVLALRGFYAHVVNWAGDWRAATEYLLSSRKAGDAAIFHVSGGLDAYRYYEDRVPAAARPVGRPAVLFPRPEELASAKLVPTYERLQPASGFRRLWMVFHVKTATDLPPAFLRSFRLISERRFAGVDPTLDIVVALYEPTAPAAASIGPGEGPSR